MSMQSQARALMNRHHHSVKNRQQSLLCRTAAQVGMPAEAAEFWGHVQGKPSHDSRVDYDRSGASMS